MRLTTKGRYAVMALVDLASADSGRPMSLADIALRQDISLSYLEQLFAGLRRGGVVRSVRGPGGGYLLARPAVEITIADIVGAIDEAPRSSQCAPTAPESCPAGGPRCATHELWDGLGRQVRAYLTSVSLADVAQRRLSPAETRPAAAELRPGKVTRGPWPHKEAAE